MSLLWIIELCTSEIVEATEACWFLSHKLACSSDVLQYFCHLVHVQTLQTLQHSQGSNYRQWPIKSTLLESVMSFYLWPSSPNPMECKFLQISHTQPLGAFMRSLSPKIWNGPYYAWCNNVQCVTSCDYSLVLALTSHSLPIVASARNWPLPKFDVNWMGKQIKKRNPQRIEASACCHVAVN